MFQTECAGILAWVAYDHRSTNINRKCPQKKKVGNMKAADVVQSFPFFKYGRNRFLSSEDNCELKGNPFSLKNICIVVFTKNRMIEAFG